MANLPTVTVKSTWVDASGKHVSFTFNVQLQSVAGVWQLSAIRSAATAVLSKIDALTDCALLNYELAIPLSLTLSNQKANADADSTARRHAYVLFDGAAGDNTRVETVEIHVPDPVSSAVDLSGIRPRLKTTDADVSSFISAVVSNAKTRGGEDVAGYRTSLVGMPVVSKRSKQAA